jgi:hypothetical protein
LRVSGRTRTPALDADDKGVDRGPPGGDRGLLRRGRDVAGRDLRTSFGDGSATRPMHELKRVRVRPKPEGSGLPCVLENPYTRGSGWLNPNPTL